MCFYAKKIWHFGDDNASSQNISCYIFPLFHCTLYHRSSCCLKSNIIEILCQICALKLTQNFCRLFGDYVPSVSKVVCVSKYVRPRHYGKEKYCLKCRDCLKLFFWMPSRSNQFEKYFFIHVQRRWSQIRSECQTF